MSALGTKAFFVFVLFLLDKHLSTPEATITPGAPARLTGHLKQRRSLCIDCESEWFGKPPSSDSNRIQDITHPHPVNYTGLFHLKACNLLRAAQWSDILTVGEMCGLTNDVTLTCEGGRNDTSRVDGWLLAHITMLPPHSRCQTNYVPPRYRNAGNDKQLQQEEGRGISASLFTTSHYYGGGGGGGGGQYTL